MALTPETEAQILRHHHAERWPIGTIATQLNLHRDSVARVIAQAGLPTLGTVHRPSAIDPYLPFILETLTQYPRLRASRLYDMVKDRGYPGRPDHFRHLIARHRPRPKSEAYLRLRTLPGEQMQIDWGHFGHLDIGRAHRPLMGFVAVLSWSRQIFLRFYLGAHMENFLRGHVGAMTAWGGCPRIALYDNLKSAVLERHGAVIRFHPTLLALSGHYHFDPRPVAVARGNEKGRVERAIRYIRDAFFAGRTFTSVEDLNAQADAWVLGRAGERRCPEDETLTVSDAFAQEKERLLALPGDAFPTDEIKAVSAGKTPYVRFDLNDYSIPHTCVARTLTVAANPKDVRILDGSSVIASHPRSYDRREQIELPEHIATLVAHKHQASAHRGTDHLIKAVPASRELLTQATERGEPLGRTVRALTEMLATYGVAELEAAITEALAREVPHPNAVRLALERRRQANDTPPPIAITLPDHVKHRDVPVRPHNLNDYDHLMETDDDQC
ncbi:MAG: IS21 family transposase [Rhodocyclaceae bacterium]|nr:IS21 family transposase [Rhodocyclaceae bacterium]MDZ4213538.1 IS21 family transposase [Rhodocyclaceae bacterium]